MSPDDDEPYIDPLRELRESNRIYLNLVDGVPWASDSYWAVEMPDATHWLARRLSAYNIDFDQPAHVSVEETLRRAGLPDDGPKDIGALVVRKLPKGLEKVERRCINGIPVLAADEFDGRTYAPFDIPGNIAIVNDALRKLVERMTPGAEWYGCSDPLKPLVRKAGDRVTGCLMACRHKLNGTIK